MKITQSYIRSLKPAEERYFKIDDNLEARVSPNGKITLSFRYKSGGSTKRIRLAKLPSNKVSRDEANALDHDYQTTLFRRSQLGDLVEVAAKGIARRKEAKSQKVTIADASALYLDEFIKNKRSGTSETSYHKNHILPHIGRLNPREVTHANLQMVINMVGRHRRTTQRHVGKAITRFFKWLKRNGYIDSREVALDLEKPGERKSKRVFSEEELIEYTTHTHNAIVAIAYCPMRASEALSLNWEEFEGTREEGGWHNVRVKSDNDDEHIVRFFLTPELMRYVEHDEGLFWRGRWGKTPLSQNSLGEVFRTRRKELGIGKSGDGVHTFRKSFATWAQSQKIPEREWRMCLGHSIPGLTGVYGLHQYLDEKRDIWERWAKHLDQLRGVSKGGEGLK